MPSDVSPGKIEGEIVFRCTLVKGARLKAAYYR